MKRAFVAAAALSIGRTVYAATAKTCPESGICYELNIPDTTARSGSGDIYFQLSAPTSYQWVAVGQGSGMAGSNIFVMYTSADGTNVTVSPRLGTGFQQPLHDIAAQITLLEGSGVSDRVMTANVRCSNCESWSGGSMDLTGTRSNWIHAYKQGSALNSDDLAENIQQHDQSAPFNWDLSQARGGADVNPFVGSAGNTAGPTPSTVASTGPSSSPLRIRTALPFKSLVWIHVATQTLALLIFIVAVGLGLHMATTDHQLSQAHPIIGLVLFVSLLLQPVLGWMHHGLYKKYAGRTLWSDGHLSIGRIAIVFGMINGGLGLQLAYAGSGAKIAYGVVAGIVGVVYLAAIVYGEVRRNKHAIGNGQDEKGRDGLDREGSGSSGQQELLAWLNGLLQLNITKVEQCGTGAAYCQIYDSIFLDIPMSRVKFNANSEYQYLENFKILSNCFRKHHVDRPLTVEQLTKCKMQDNLEFLQWTKRYWDQYYPGGDYDALARRKGAGPGAGPGASAPAPTPTSARTSTSANTGARRPGPAGGMAATAPRTTSRQAGGGGPASTVLQQKNAELMETVQGLERERDFYFSKLRDIELLIQQAMEADAALEEDEGSLLKQIQTILYSTEEGFEIPAEAETEAVGEEETF
ncbi:hypothetical protein B0A55_07059 [Friedmanniomyces simplex]|uniref:EB1 C-terminal domain-containing protein n=1 Tax=Friedmanniomyces simplex TaxID=329884 RepID=A0A4U0X6L7_9PEZI|nr:hypothetical protein B0A55_07059 [Friedmanniomyces simplex]